MGDSKPRMQVLATPSLYRLTAEVSQGGPRTVIGDGGRGRDRHSGKPGGNPDVVVDSLTETPPVSPVQ